MIRMTLRQFQHYRQMRRSDQRVEYKSLRGDLVSRPIIQVLAEAERLVKAGVKEILVISQDTSAYGIDSKYKAYPWKDRTIRTKFIDLCRELGELGVEQLQQPRERLRGEALPGNSPR